MAKVVIVKMNFLLKIVFWSDSVCWFAIKLFLRFLSNLLPIFVFHIPLEVSSPMCISHHKRSRKNNTKLSLSCCMTKR